MTDYDRTVHGRTTDGRDIVRYDRAGKWYLEGGGQKRERITLTRAAELAIVGEWFSGKPGGQMFDAKVHTVVVPRDG